MGRINLGREQGIRVTEKQNTGVSTQGYSQVSAGLSAQARATDNLVKGMQHISKVTADISHDMAETRNAVDFADYQMNAFKIDQAELTDKMEADMMSGKINSQASFDEAYKKYSAIATQKRNDFASTQGYAPSVFDKISISDKNEEKRNFAHLSGRFIHYENKRIWDKTETMCKEFASMGAIGVPEIKKAVNNLTKYSPELREKIIFQYTTEAYKNEADYIVNTANNQATNQATIDYATKTSEQIRNGEIKVGNERQAETIANKLDALVNKTQIAMRKQQRTEEKHEVWKSNQTEKAKNEQIKIYTKEIDTIQTQSLTNLTTEKLTPLRDETIKKLETYRGKVPDHILNQKIADTNKTFENAIQNAVKQSKKQRIVELNNVVKSAMENGGEIPYFDDGYTKTTKETSDSETLKKASEGESFTEDSIYTFKSNELFKNIYNLKNSTIEDNPTLVGYLINQCNNLRPDDKKLALEMLNYRLSDTPPPEWSKEEWKSFEKNLDTKILWNDGKDEDDTEAVIYSSFTSNLRKELTNKGIKTSVEAMEYVEKHPIYKNMMGKKCAKYASMLVMGKPIVKMADSDNKVAQWKSFTKEEKKRKIAYSKTFIGYAGVSSAPSVESITDQDIKDYEKEYIYAE